MGNYWFNLIKEEEPEPEPDSDSDFESLEYESKEVCISRELPIKGIISRACSLDTDVLELDANHYNAFRSFETITWESVIDIEGHLEQYEKVALSFLLYEGTEDCLSNKSLSTWAKRQSEFGDHWRKQLIEALAVIQNFELLKKFGFQKRWLQFQFYPHRYFTAKYINKFRRMLYYICEELEKEQEKIFLKNIELDFKVKRLEYNKYPFLEMYFCHFLNLKYISETNVKNCLTIFKRMGFDNICSILEEFEKDSTCIEVAQYQEKLPIQKSISKDDGVSESFSATSLASNSTQDNTGSRRVLINKIQQDNAQTSDKYDMSKSKKCLIIDEEVFYMEFRDEYKHLLPDNIGSQKLRERIGTFHDSQKLSAVLMSRKFDVVIKRNRNHLDVIRDLETFIENIEERNCSCVFVAVLSHGDEGIVYASNSCSIEVSKLIDIMCQKKLKGIPKVLLMQSCQGPKLQMEVTNLDTDGPVKSARFKDTDFLIFWSTVPGFSSVRDKLQGSWFIQSFCNQLEQARPDEHLLEICTKITQEVSAKRWELTTNKVCLMVPYTHFTLTKKLCI